MISDVYFPRVNGVSTSIRTFRRDLEALGCTCWLIAPEYPGAWEDGSSVVRVPSRYLVFDPEDRLMSVRRAVRASRDLRQPFDVVHIHTPFAAHYAGLRIARAAGVPALESYHTYFEEYFHLYCRWLPRSWLKSLARTVSRRQCDAVDGVVAPAEILADVLRGYGIRSSIDVIPTGLNLSEFTGGDGARFRARFGIDPARPVMLHVGRVAFEKNIAFIVNVLERVRQGISDVLLVIAGEGPALGALRRDVRSADSMTTSCSSAIWIGATHCSTAIGQRTCSPSLRARRPRGWSSSKHLPWVYPSCPRPCSARGKCSPAPAARSSSTRTSTNLPAL
jgi:glycosyltransferase involved in cell wall biosynthesis